MVILHNSVNQIINTMATDLLRSGRSHPGSKTESKTGTPEIDNEAAEGVPYFTPAQNPPAGTAVDPQPDGKPIPKLFQPLKIRGMDMQNRIMVSPLCQYSAHEGFHTPWHVTHLGGIAQRGVSFCSSVLTYAAADTKI